MRKPIFVAQPRTMKAAGGNMVSISDLDDWMDAQIEARLGGADSVQNAYAAVPWLFRGVSIIAQAVASLPFVIETLDGTEVDNSEDYQNALEFLPKLTRLLKLVAACIVLTGRAYIRREANRYAQANGKISGVKWYAPFTITPKIDEAQGLIGFIRRVNGKVQELAVDALVYFWEEDPFIEEGPPSTSAGQAALNAAGVLLSLDVFVEAFFKRGAIKATILTLDGNPPAGEKERIRAWWKRFIGGLKNAFASEVFSANVKPVVVGEGVKELENNLLTMQKREDIATAIGVPQSILFSNATNFATAQQDDLHLYSKTIIPLAEFIADVLNEQLLNALGYRIRFLGETLDIFQEDENARAGGLASLVSAGLPLGVAMEMLGFQLPEHLAFDDFNPGGKYAVPEPLPVQVAGPALGPGKPYQAKEAKLVGGDAANQTKAAERIQYKAFNRRNPRRAFRFEHLDAAEQAELVAETHQENEQRALKERIEATLAKVDEAIK